MTTLAPGVRIATAQRHTPSRAPTDTRVVFVAGTFERGPLTPTETSSFAEFTSVYGGRTTDSQEAWDWIDIAFREARAKGAELHVVVLRVVGEDPVVATLTLEDGAGTPVDTARVDAVSPGAWGNGIRVQVLAGVAGGTFKLKVTDHLGAITGTAGTVLHETGDLADKAAAVAYFATSPYVRFVDLGAGADPAVLAATSLATGDADIAGITDTEWQAAHDTADIDWGPGQLVEPGQTTTASRTRLARNAVAYNRFALHELVDTDDVATLTAAALEIRALGNEAGERSQAWGSSVSVPGPSDSPGSTRVVSWTAIAAALFAAVDATHGTSQPPAGELGESDVAIELTQPKWSETDRGTLEDAGVAIARDRFGDLRAYSDVTCADPDTSEFPGVGDARLRMAIVAEARQAGESIQFRRTDGRRRVLSTWESRLKGVLLAHYDRDELFGSSPDDAFRVDVASPVNTDESLAAKELNADLTYKNSPANKYVNVSITKVPITEAV